MPFSDYYDAFIAPALAILAAENEKKIGVAFVRWICKGTNPNFNNESDALLWNCLMLACNKEFNPQIMKMTANQVQALFKEMGYGE